MSASPIGASGSSGWKPGAARRTAGGPTSAWTRTCTWGTPWRNSIGSRQTGARVRPTPLLGTGTLHVPLVAGGRQRFIYAERCTAEVECRTVPGQTAGGVLGDLQAALAAVAGRVDQFDGTVAPVMWRAPWQIDPARPIVRTVMDAATAVRQTPPQLIGHGWWEDSALLGEAGIETVVLGPSGGGLHTEQEWVDCDSVVDLAEILRRSILMHCVEV
jgi:acetylornithine deacetylase